MEGKGSEGGALKFRHTRPGRVRFAWLSNGERANTRHPVAESTCPSRSFGTALRCPCKSRSTRRTRPWLSPGSLLAPPLPPFDPRVAVGLFKSWTTSSQAVEQAACHAGAAGKRRGKWLEYKGFSRLRRRGKGILIAVLEKKSFSLFGERHSRGPNSLTLFRGSSTSDRRRTPSDRCARDAPTTNAAEGRSPPES